MIYKGSSIMRESNPFGLRGVLIEFFRIGYEKPELGDRCIAEARISLPATKGKLDDEYCFGQLVILCGQPLNEDWGKEFTAGLRTSTMQASGETWPEVFEGLEKDVVEELKKLAKAYKYRQTILAEKDELGLL